MVGDRPRELARELGKKGRTGLSSVTIHDLKTYLTAIIASAEMLSEELKTNTDSTIGKLTDTIIRNAHRMDDELSFLSEIDKLSEDNFSADSINVRTVIKNVVSQMAPLTQSKRQILNIELPETLPEVKANTQYLEQIISTLIANASKFTPEGGKIKVRAVRENNQLAVHVEDNGVGIPIDEQEKLFQPRYQVIKSKSNTGTGLGLAIARLLIELHGGKIGLKSTVGQGSDFYFTLPLPA